MTKSDLNRATGVGISNLAAKSSLVSFKAEVDKKNVDKLKTVPADLGRVSIITDDNVVEKNVYKKLVSKVNAIDTSGFVNEKKIHDTDKKDPTLMNLLRKTDYNAKITEIESNIPSTKGLATCSILNAIENKIPNISDQVKKQILIQKYQTFGRNILPQLAS